MTIDIHQESLDFMKRENIHPSHAPLAIIKKAMTHGASLAIKLAADKVAAAGNELRKQHAANLQQRN
jgi:hypothetical protein